MERLFYDNPDLFEFEANTVEIKERDKRFYLVLDKTAFYPEGGGQPSDRGFIDGIAVLDVLEEGETIYHVLPSKPKNKLVKCHVDRERRFDLMQQHTGQHLLSAVFYSLYEGETSSFHLGEDYVSIDISLTEITRDMLYQVESVTNEYIYKNLKIKSYIIDGDEIPRLPLRKLPSVSENIRIVEIDNFDYSPCCGTHVSTTGQIGIIKIVKIEKYKGVTRVYFKCGKRAFKDYSQKHDIVSNISASLSTPETELAPRVEVLLTEVKSSNKSLKELKEKLLAYETRELLSTLKSKLLCQAFNDKSFEDLPMIVRLGNEAGSYIYILTSLPDKKLLFAHSGEFNLSCGKIFKEHLGSFNGRGGGSDKQAQAGFNDVKDLLEFQEFLKEKVKGLV